MGFPDGSVVKNLPVNVGDRIRSLGLEDPLEKETAPYICLKNIMDREVWQTAVHGVTKSWPQLSNWI